jgi:antitoxin component of MazEF toxin-antitoxin module
MKIVKVRRAGNSLAVTIPPDLGLTEGQEVVIGRAPDGRIFIVPAGQLDALVQAVAGNVARQRRGVLDRLAAHDREQKDERATA